MKLLDDWLDFIDDIIHLILITSIVALIVYAPPFLAGLFFGLIVWFGFLALYLDLIAFIAYLYWILWCGIFISYGLLIWCDIFG